MIRSRVVAPAIVLVLFLSVTPWAQWPGNPDSNMVICERRGEQTLPKVAAVSDGGCYISWYDHVSGNYDVYMQRLDGDGLLQWDENGLLINNHTQQSWLTDYDMTVDGEDHAILVVNDIRNGGDLDIYAYRMSPDGEFVWGEDGITISDNDGFEPDPRVTVTSAGNVVIAWQEDEVVHLRKLTPDGTDYWDPPIITLTSTYGMANPRIAPADNDGAILQAVVASGPNYWDPQYLYAYKFDADGAHQWGPDGVAVSIAGGIALWMDLEIASDGAGGMYSYWYDTRNNVHHAYVQHIESDGNVAWTVNGVTLSTAANELQMYPSLVRLPGTEDVLVFYSATDPNQNNYGVHGQRLNSAGERQWGDGGIALVPIGNLVRWAIHGLQQEDGAIVTYFEDIDAVNSLVKAIRVDGDGNQVWGTSPVTMATTISDKGHFATDVNDIGQVIDVWYDDRIDIDRDIYLQNVNPDGSLGAYAAPTVVSIEMIPDNPPVVVPAGGSFTYTGILTNNTDEQQVTDVAVLLRIPAGRYYGPLVRYNNVRLNPGQTISIAGITQNVPGYAPLGVYDYIAGCGDYPRTVVDTVSFQFTVIAPAAGGAGDWSLNGWFNEEIQPVDYILHPNFPNPFNAATRIDYLISVSDHVKLDIYNIAGQKVSTLVDNFQPAGTHSIIWDGSGASSGVYFYVLTTGSGSKTQRMTLVK